MNRPAILLVYKRSAYTRYRQKFPLAAIRGPLRLVLKASHARHQDALLRVGAILESRGYRLYRSFRSDLSRGRDSYARCPSRGSGCGSTGRPFLSRP